MSTSKAILPHLKKGDRTTVSGLFPGDRFYKVSDKQRRVWEVEEIKMRDVYCKTENMHISIPMAKNTQVVFIRNINDDKL